MDKTKGKKFLPKDFLSDSNIEKMTGVYFPYWYIDTQQDSHMTARGKKYRHWKSGDRRYTETSYYDLFRSGDVYIRNVFERALSAADREMLQCIHPYDLSEAQPFSMSYLSGFQAEKRDIEKSDIQMMVDQKIDEYCKEVLKGACSEYSGIEVTNYYDRTDIESWSYTLLPVWIITYKYKGKIYPFAINGQTGKFTAVCLPQPISLLYSPAFWRESDLFSVCWEVYSYAEKYTFRCRHSVGGKCNACGFC